MASVIKKAFDITRDNIVTAQPLIVFLLIISLTTVGLAQQSNKIAFIIFFISNFLLTTAFLAGWFYMVKKTVLLSKVEYEKPEERTAASFDLLKDFFPGVSAYFVPVTVVFLIYVLLSAGIIYLVGVEWGFGYLTSHNVHLTKIYQAALQSQQALEKYLYSMTFGQIQAINIWMMAVTFAAAVYSFLTLFWFPALFYMEKINFLSPFTSFWKNIKFLFKNFLGALGIMCFLSILNFAVFMVNAVFSINIILSVIAFFIMFYFATYYIILIFLYYDTKQ